MKKSALFLVLAAFLASGYARNCNIDSLSNLLHTESENQYEIEFELGMCYYESGQNDSAIHFFERVVPIAKEKGNTKQLALSFYHLGLSYYNKSNGLESLDQFHNALRIPDGLTIEEKLAAYNVMGIIHMIFGEYEEAIFYFDKALACVPEVYEITGNSSEFLYNNKGITFAKNGDYDSSMVNHQRCLKIRLEQGNNYAIGQSYNNLGSLYYEIDKPDSALYFFEKGFEYRQKDEDVPVTAILESKINIAKASISLGALNRSAQLLKEVEMVLDDLNNPDLALRLKNELMRLYHEKQNYKLAYDYAIDYFELKDSVYGIEKREELIRIDLSNKYAEKKLQDSLVAAEQAKLAEIEKERQQEIQSRQARETAIIQWSLVIALILMLGIIILIYSNYKSKKRASDQILLQKQEVEKQRDIARKEKQVADEQREIAQDQKLKLELVHQEITDSINYAKRIQNAVLPADQIVKKTLGNHFIVYKPKAIVAGDFYWINQLGDKIFFAAADCTGHGVPGALVSIVCSNALNRSIEEFELNQPGAILDKTTDLLIEALVKDKEEVKDGMDIALCSWDIKSRTLEFAGANNPIYIIKPGHSDSDHLKNEKFHLIELKGTKQAVGWYENRQAFETTSLSLESGDWVYSFSDGFPDQFGGPRGKKYKYKPFKEFLLNIAHLSPEIQGLALEREFELWKGDLEQVDDVCIIGFQIP